MNQLAELKDIAHAVAEGNTHLVNDIDTTCSFCGAVLSDDELHEEDCETLIARQVLGDEWVLIDFNKFIADVDAAINSNKTNIESAIQSEGFIKAGELSSINSGLESSFECIKRARLELAEKDVITLRFAIGKLENLINKHMIERDEAVKLLKYEESAQCQNIIEGINRAIHLLTNSVAR